MGGKAVRYLSPCQLKHIPISSKFYMKWNRDVRKKVHINFHLFDIEDVTFKDQEKNSPFSCNVHLRPSLCSMNYSKYCCCCKAA
jgi:hypothetical protein